MAYVKTGYQDSVEFDPDKGIIKYGDYEFFADQVGAAPKSTTLNFDTYKKSLAYNGGETSLATFAANQNKSDAALRKQFEADVLSGSVKPVTTKPSNPLYGAPEGLYNIDNKEKTSLADFVGLGLGNSAPKNEFSKTIKNKDGSITQTSYKIPTDIGFINSLNSKASQISNASAQGQVTDASRPNPKNGRLGKANLSRAATVLTDGALAGAPTSLGGATGALGG